ncbi:nodulation protein NfeD [Rhodopirellula sp. JC740]|uniref:Nodulation protein NfeD n=1 Tax=Rhodopirellula halodulae TaxID=2894198 RepID=A0ABS8NN11_9BACT|nr:NfeD family protein [Rhodopirellula sp. JC740]MCC9644950.1 nodulation protein NfeD [Rhodopirellula sp. JC740]
MPVLYSVGLVVLFLTLLIAEIMVPSGGILGLLAFASAITAVLIAFTVSLNFGLSIMLVLIVATPILLHVLLRFWPQTSAGRAILNRRRRDGNESVPVTTTLDGVPLDQLVGSFGVATSNLLPSGRVIVDGHKVDAVSTGMPIDKGQPIKVVRVAARKLQVRLATEEEVQQANEASLKASHSTQERSPRDDVDDASVTTSVLESSKTLEEMDLDELEE